MKKTTIYAIVAILLVVGAGYYFYSISESTTEDTTTGSWVQNTALTTMLPANIATADYVGGTLTCTPNTGGAVAYTNTAEPDDLRIVVDSVEQIVPLSPDFNGVIYADPWTFSGTLNDHYYSVTHGTTPETWTGDPYYVYSNTIGSWQYARLYQRVGGSPYCTLIDVGVFDIGSSTDFVWCSAV